MKRYSFRLEQVLRIRQAQEEVALQELSRANKVLRSAVAHREAQLSRYLDLYRADPATDVEGFRLECEERERSAAMLAEAQRRASEARAEADRRIQQWQMANRRVAALERLDERRRAEHELEVSRAEASAVDDLVTSRWIAANGERRHGRALTEVRS